MTLEQKIESYRPLLFSVALDILGDIKDAEDVVQETLVKWLRNNPLSIDNTKAYLVRAVINSSINFKKLLRNKLEVEFNDWMPDWMPEKTTVDALYTDLEQELMEAYTAMRERLSPSERGVFVLKELFDMDYDEISHVLERQTVNCRKLFSRAKKAMVEKKERFVCSYEEQKKGFSDFLEASRHGKLEQLINFLRDEMDKKQGSDN